MREILFRGKIKETKAWKFGFIAKHKFEFEKEEVFIIEEEKTGSCADVIPETIGQFTGLTDKNGNKIFEGDIIHVDNYDDGWNSMIEFKGGAFAVDVEGKEYDYTAIGWLEYEVQIIGNIHDNPELLS